MKLCYVCKKRPAHWNVTDCRVCAGRCFASCGERGGKRTHEHGRQTFETRWGSALSRRIATTKRLY